MPDKNLSVYLNQRESSVSFVLQCYYLIMLYEEQIPWNKVCLFSLVCMCAVCPHAHVNDLLLYNTVGSLLFK